MLLVVAFTTAEAWWEGGVEITGYEAGEGATGRQMIGPGYRNKIGVLYALKYA